jgi:eukaryotic-like serine/threonine-protein kinase
MEDRQKIKELFHEALDVPLSERADFLAANCRDEETRNEVENLLKFHDAAGDFIVAPAVIESGAVGEIFGEETENRIGEKIGHYEIVREIGRGGMGAVYLAIRADDEFRQEVALKIVKRGMDTDFIVNRFRNERQILAGLNHPNIARLLEGGTTDDGLPYFVMEYVDGKYLLTYCNEKNLALEERLTLFRRICSAVSYAHQNLIVHRDLKPSNILISDDGTPKLLDFGIAKILNPEGENDKTTGIFRLLTPEYASPEQIRGEQITTASDVYSLGVILYELLTGQSPYQTNSKSYDEIVRAVCATEPNSPSSVVSRPSLSDTNQTSEYKGQRTKDEGQTTNPKSKIQNPKSLRGDLDNIILKALQKEVSRRYNSVQEFSEDIRRHQVGLPVTAQADTYRYRATKFVKRHRAGVFAGVLIFLSLVGGITATTWQSYRATAEKLKAEQRFNQVRKLANTILFDYHERIKTLPGATEARQKLVTDALEYLDNLAQNSDNAPDLQRELAAAYQKVGEIQSDTGSGGTLGKSADALENYRKAVAIREKLAAQTATDADRHELAKSYTFISRVVSDTGDVKSTENYCHRAVAILSEIVEKDAANRTAQSDLAKAFFALATPLRKRGDYDAAIDVYRRAGAIYENLAATEETAEKRTSHQRNFALTYKSLGGIAEEKGDKTAAMEFYRQALEIDTKNAAENPNDVQYQLDAAFSYNSVASILEKNESYAEAIEYCGKALAIQEKATAADAKNAFAKFALGRTYRRMGILLQKIGEIEKSAAHYQKSIAILEELVQADPNSTGYKSILAQTSADYGKFLFKTANDNKSRLHEAQKFQKKGLEIFTALKTQNALAASYEKDLSTLQTDLQQTEAELAK